MKKSWNVSYSVASGSLTTYAINKESVSHKKAKENVKLIAAAPDMFNVLQLILNENELDSEMNELIERVLTQAGKE